MHSRRRFLQTAAGAATLATLPQPRVAASATKPRPRVAAIFTEFRFRSHAYNILENFFEPYLFRGRLVDPGVDIVSFYADQFPANDMARRVARDRRIPLYRDIGSALRVGNDDLAVDAVLLIGEHGDYPLNKLGQKMYPRKRFFDAIVEAAKDSERAIPVFNDKHLSYRWDWSKEMYDLSRARNLPLMAGSSVPLAERRPHLEIKPGENISEAIAIHGGGIESYDFHGLEVLLSMIEFRRGGESGVEQVELLSGEKLQGAIRDKRWSPDLVDAAWQAEQQTGIDRQPRPGQTATTAARSKRRPRINHALCLKHSDGLESFVLNLGSSSNRWSFAYRRQPTADPLATFFYNGPWGNRCLFKALSHAIQHHFVHGKAPYPVERTLLVSGILVAAMQSHLQEGRAIATPHLKIAYKPQPFAEFREDGESWKIITAETRQPADFAPGDRKFLR